MNKVTYASKGGNTKKLAEAIAKGAGTQAISIEQAGSLGDIDILFVGASIYAGNIDRKLKIFLQTLKSSQIKTVVIFGTSAGKKTALPEIKEILSINGITVLDDEFHCKGSFLLAHRGHPDDQDLNDAENFSRKMCGAKV